MWGMNHAWKCFPLFCREIRARKIPLWLQIENFWRFVRSLSPWKYFRIGGNCCRFSCWVNPMENSVTESNHRNSFTNQQCLCILFSPWALSKGSSMSASSLDPSTACCNVNIQHSPVIVIDERKGFPREERKWWKWAPAQHPCAPHDDDDAVFLAFSLSQSDTERILLMLKGKNRQSRAQL